MSEIPSDSLPSGCPTEVSRHVISAYLMGALGCNFLQLANHLEAVEIAAYSVFFKWHVRPSLPVMAAAERAVEVCLEGDFQVMHMWGDKPVPAEGTPAPASDKPAPKEDPTDWRDVCEGFAAPL